MRRAAPLHLLYGRSFNQCSVALVCIFLHCTASNISASSVQKRKLRFWWVVFFFVLLFCNIRYIVRQTVIQTYNIQQFVFFLFSHFYFTVTSNALPQCSISQLFTKYQLILTFVTWQQFKRILAFLSSSFPLVLRLLFLPLHATSPFAFFHACIFLEIEQISLQLIAEKRKNI